MAHIWTMKNGRRAQKLSCRSYCTFCYCLMSGWYLFPSWSYGLFHYLSKCILFDWFCLCWLVPFPNPSLFHVLQYEISCHICHLYFTFYGLCWKYCANRIAHLVTWCNGGLWVRWISGSDFLRLGCFCSTKLTLLWFAPPVWWSRGCSVRKVQSNTQLSVSVFLVFYDR